MSYIKLGKMSNKSKKSTLETVYDYVKTGLKKSIIYLNTTDNSYNGREISVDESMINFGSCSYLGLEVDKRVINSAKEYMDRYGIQFSSSRSYLTSMFQQDIKGFYLLL